MGVTLERQPSSSRVSSWTCGRRTILKRVTASKERTVEDREDGTVYEVKPGRLYGMDDHDRHRIRAKSRMRIICTFYPALTGDEVHDADGSL